jgi:hypothetical protein
MAFFLAGYGISCVPFELPDLPSSGYFVTSGDQCPEHLLLDPSISRSLG